MPPPQSPLPPSTPPVAPSTSFRCAFGDGGQKCDCKPGLLFYGPRYTNERATTDSTQWVEATTIEAMVATGLAVGYKQAGAGKCWFSKGFLDLDTNQPFGSVDPLPGIGSTNRQCFCRTYEPPVLGAEQIKLKSGSVPQYGSSYSRSSHRSLCAKGYM